MNPTLYDVIGLTPEASEKKIYRAVKRVAKSIKESDVSEPEKKKLVKMIKKARDTLMDPQSREEYDRSIGIETIREVGSDGTNGSLVPFESSGPIGSMISNHMNMIQSIIPQGFGDIREMGTTMQPGTFHFMEYTTTIM